MDLSPSTEQDVRQLTEWIKQDPHHRHLVNPHWWLTGNGILSYRIIDSHGVTMYVRLEADNNLMRIHTQFGPEEQISKVRVIKCLLWTLPKMEIIAKQFGLVGFIFKSTSPGLILFMKKKFGFTPIGNDDYQLLFEDGKNVRT